LAFGVFGQMDPDMNELEQSPTPDTAARLEGCLLAVGALLLVGIGFRQHYENYVDAEQDRASINSVQTAPGGANGSTMAVMRLDTAETFEHAKTHVRVSDILRRDCRYR